MIRIIIGDCRETLRGLSSGSVQTCVTSPPYFGLRDYGHTDQIGLEETPDAYCARLVDVFREVRRALRDDGTCWLNLGDSYNSGSSGGLGGSTLGGGQQNQAASNRSNSRKLICKTDGVKPKDLLGIPWRVAFALQADGWYLRQDIIWHKPNPMPESVTDRCTKAHEYIFLLSKSDRYFFDAEAIKELAVKGAAGSTFYRGKTASHQMSRASESERIEDGTRNRRSVWTVTTKPFKGAHFATFPPDLIEPCILAGSPPGGVVLDPFGGAGTTGLVAGRLQRTAILCELNPDYAEMARDRIVSEAGMLASVTLEDHDFNRTAREEAHDHHHAQSHPRA